MTDMQTINTFLSSPDWHESTKWVIRWQFRLLGNFQTALADTIARADVHNLELLECGFPMQVNGFRQWAHEDLAQRLRKAGLGI